MVANDFRISAEWDAFADPVNLVLVPSIFAGSGGAQASVTSARAFSRLAAYRLSATKILSCSIFSIFLRAA